MTEPMSTEEWHEFVSSGTLTGKLGVVRADGRPHVVPIWFILDDDGCLRLTTAHDGLKAKAIRRDPRVVLCVDNQAPPYSFVKIDATAELSDGHDEMLRVATACGARYIGPEQAEAFGERNAVPEEVLVTLRPISVVAQRDISA